MLNNNGDKQMKNTIAQWSQTYYSGLTDEQHQANNEWFQQMAQMTTKDGVIMVPNLGIAFKSNGETWEEA